MTRAGSGDGGGGGGGAPAAAGFDADGILRAGASVGGLLGASAVLRLGAGDVRARAPRGSAEGALRAGASAPAAAAGAPPRPPGPRRPGLRHSSAGPCRVPEPAAPHFDRFVSDGPGVCVGKRGGRGNRSLVVVSIGSDDW